MNRRQLLKNIGLGAGAIVVGPTMLSLLESCSRKEGASWNPLFLSSTNAFALEKVLEVILPATDTPGATELNLAQFIDGYMEEVSSPYTQRKFKESADAFAFILERESGKKPQAASVQDYEMVVSKYLRSTSDQRNDFLNRISETQDPADSMAALDIQTAEGAFAYLKNVRELGIWAWKTSEEIGEKVLWYDPVPGTYIACTPASEVGNGKAMSL